MPCEMSEVCVLLFISNAFSISSGFSLVKLYIVRGIVVYFNWRLQWHCLFFSPKTIAFKYHLFNNYVYTLESKL